MTEKEIQNMKRTDMLKSARIQVLEKQLEKCRKAQHLFVHWGDHQSIAQALGIKVSRRYYLRKALTAAIAEQHHKGNKTINILDVMMRMDELANNQNERAWLNYSIGRAMQGLATASPRPREEQKN